MKMKRLTLSIVLFCSLLLVASATAAEPQMIVRSTDAEACRALEHLLFGRSVGCVQGVTIIVPTVPGVRVYEVTIYYEKGGILTSAIQFAAASKRSAAAVFRISDFKLRRVVVLPLGQTGSAIEEEY
jgi:hypothetical protein